MATVLLQSAGAFIGSFFGPIGSAIGSAAGAMAGYMIDNQIIQSLQSYEGARLSGMKPLDAEEGGVIPRLYGSARLPGTLIWATRFEERKTTRRQGVKGGPKVTEYDYFANVAFALCEGEISFVRRVWADGRELDLNKIDMRVHRGSQDQSPDPLIEARQGQGNAPSYRGTAYVVFERMPLDSFGNRIPQFQFEVVRACGGIGERISAITLIPGATEFGLHPDRVRRQIRRGRHEAVNRHILHGETDLQASLDELQALCPNLVHVSVVVPWFGDDLRAGHCTIRPGVTESLAGGMSHEWSVAGTSRSDARRVSRIDGNAAYGGTPDDASLIALIGELKQRGLKVTLYPFVMMDIAQGNALPDPWGGVAQAAYPWRGRITGQKAPGFSGSTDATAAVIAEIAYFLGNTLGSTSHAIPHLPDWGASSNPWGYRRLVLHYAALAASAGGVDAFLIGSELRGLTRLRDHQDAFPFVHSLRHLAREVRAILGMETRLTYGADWTEYASYRPNDGSGDLFWPLDPLWADEVIDAVGIENYMPLSDWRDEDWQAGNPDGMRNPWDCDAMRSGIEGGEGFDWYFANAEGRDARERLPITDGAHGKPWVYRFKDIRAWWQNSHVERRGGIEIGGPSPWVPGSKPVWFTELGCPAIDKGANQPNVFYDPKSSESHFPYHSSGTRDDLVQARFLEAHFSHWSNPANNPVSSLTGKSMLDPQRLYCWAWDARPYPAFPLLTGVWSDGGNWRRGHWLNGRLELADLGSVINEVLAGHGLPEAEVSQVDALVEGLVIDKAGSARDILEPQVALFGIRVSEQGGSLVFKSRQAEEAAQLGDLAEGEEGASFTARLDPVASLPDKAVVAFRDPLLNHQAATVSHVRAGSSGTRQLLLGHSGALDKGRARALAADRLEEIGQVTRTVTFHLPAGHGLAPGQLVAFSGQPMAQETFRITSVDEGIIARIEAVRSLVTVPHAASEDADGATTLPEEVAGSADVVFLDLPMVPWIDNPRQAFRVAAWSSPWLDQQVEASPETSGFLPRTVIPAPAGIGELASELGPGHGALRERSAFLDVRFPDAEPSSVSTLQLLNWANGLAVRSSAGPWEILQFQDAMEIAPGLWRLSGLLRGQFGTEDAMMAGTPAGAAAVLLDEAVMAAGLGEDEAGLALNWRVTPSGSNDPDDSVAGNHLAGLRALTPLSPVHLRASKLADGALHLTWIRRTRIGGDSWLGTDVPLGEQEERWVVTISDAPGEVIYLQAETATASFEWAAAEVAQAASLSAGFRLTISQRGSAFGAGLPASRILSIP